MKVEDISGVGLTSRGAAEEEGHLTVGDGLLGEIVVEDHGVLAVLAEPLAHGGAGVGGEELEGGGVGRRRGDDDAVGHGATLVEVADELGDGGALLPDTDVDARKGVGLGLLVDDGVDGDGGLAGLAIANDQLTLATAHRDERVDGLEAGEHGLGHGLSGDDSGGLGGGVSPNRGERERGDLP